MLWYYAKKGQQCGPIDEDELHRLAQQGAFAPDDLVWNPSFGDTWAPASRVAGLFSTPPPLAAQDSIAGGPSRSLSTGSSTTHNRELMRMARESLQGNWGLAIGVMALYWILTIGVNYIPLGGGFAGLILDGPMMVGVCVFFLSLTRRSGAQVGHLFQGFQQFGTALAAYLLMMLFILLWALLFIIPGIIASFAYALTFYIIADDPTVGPLQAITRSKALMRGNKWKLFCLSWRFFGWSLVCLLTLGIGFLWLMPYMQTATSHFYDDVRRGL